MIITEREKERERRGFPLSLLSSSSSATTEESGVSELKQGARCIKIPMIGYDCII